MKLKIKKKWFDKIKSGEKNFEIRDAHLTLICEETGEQLKKYVHHVDLLPIGSFTGQQDDDFFDCFEDNNVIVFKLDDKEFA